MRIWAKALDHLLIADHRPTHQQDRDLGHMYRREKEQSIKWQEVGRVAEPWGTVESNA